MRSVLAYVESIKDADALTLAVGIVGATVMPHNLYLDWGGPDAHNVRDPEGLLSDLPALGTALLGLLAGLWLRAERTAAGSLRAVQSTGRGTGTTTSLAAAR